MQLPDMLQFAIEHHSGIPVYKQMTDTLIAAIQSGEIRPGERLPPIRKLSRELQVNPNTTLKVYRELELKGYIESRVGSGSFVLQREAPQLSAIEKEEKMNTMLARLLREARAFQIDEADLLQYLQRRLR